MNRSLPLAALFAAFGLIACEKPTVVNVPAPVVVSPPSAPGATGATGATGAIGATGDDGKQGKQGDTGKATENTTVVVVPPATQTK